MTYQYLQDRQFLTTINATTMTANKRRKLYKGHYTHACSSRWKADDSAQRDYDQPIHFRKVIPDDYDRDDEINNEYYDTLEEGGVLVLETG